LQLAWDRTIHSLTTKDIRKIQPGSDAYRWINWLKAEASWGQRIKHPMAGEYLGVWVLACAEITARGTDMNIHVSISPPFAGCQAEYPATAILTWARRSIQRHSVWIDRRLAEANRASSFNTSGLMRANLQSSASIPEFLIQHALSPSCLGTQLFQ